jgi:hypothetical protein
MHATTANKTNNSKWRNEAMTGQGTVTVQSQATSRLHSQQTVLGSSSKFKEGHCNWKIKHFCIMALQILVGQGLLIIEASLSLSETPHSVELHWASDTPNTETPNWQHTILKRDRHPCPWEDSISFSMIRRPPRSTPNIKNTLIILFIVNTKRAVDIWVSTVRISTCKTLTMSTQWVIQGGIQTVLDTLIEKDSQEAFQKWRRQWDRCLHAGGNYFEDDGGR